MEKIKKESKFSYGKEYENRVRQENERCFLKDKQKLKYHSFILLEIVPLEKIEQLVFGLDKLYANASLSQKSRLNYKKFLSNCHSKLFQRFVLNLPCIVSSDLKGKVLLDCIFYDLGDKIRRIYTTIYKVMPSNVILQFQVCLNNKMGEEINDKIYQYHKEIRESIETSKGESITVYGPEIKKKNEIYQLRKDLHKEAVDFLKNYFNGYFFEPSKENISVVPSIDLFSLDYPVKENDILNWGIENRPFFSCFSTSITPWESFKYENYLFCIESERDVEFNNYMIFANRETSKEKIYPDIDSAIELKLNFCSFDLIAIERWVRIQEDVVGKLSSTVLEEISKIQENKFSKAIETRKSILKNVFSFKRFGVGYKWNSFIFDKFTFTSLKDERNPERQIDLFKGLKEGIDTRTKEISNLIDVFTKQYETILNLKNLEFSKNMQTSVRCLTIVIIVLSIIQITILVIPKIPELIMKLLFGG
jgi:hypothetical protein